MGKTISVNSAKALVVSANSFLSEIIGGASYLIVRGSSNGLMLTNNLGRSVIGIQYDAVNINLDVTKWTGYSGWGCKTIQNGEQVTLLKDVNTIIFAI